MLFFSHLDMLVQGLLMSLIGDVGRLHIRYLQMRIEIFVVELKLRLEVLLFNIFGALVQGSDLLGVLLL